MAIGNFGSIITFETSDRRIISPENFKRDVSGRWAAHSRIGEKPLRQFLGPDTDKVTFTIRLDARHGVKPRRTIDTIEKYIKNGTPAKLVIGGKRIGSSQMTINSVSETWDEVWNRGELVRATLSISMEEYPS